MWYDDGPLPAEQLQSSSSPVSQTFDQTQTDNKRTGQATIIIIINGAHRLENCSSQLTWQITF